MNCQATKRYRYSLGCSKKNPHPPPPPPRRMAFHKISREGGFKGLGNPDWRGGRNLKSMSSGLILSDRCFDDFEIFGPLIFFSNCIILRTVQCLLHFFKFPSTGSIFNLILEKENREEKRITLPSGYSKCSAYAINAWNFLMLYPGHSCVGSITSCSITAARLPVKLSYPI